MKVTVSLLLLLCAAAGPATRPATAPTTQIPRQSADVAAPKVSATTRIVQRFHTMHAKFLERAKAGNVKVLFLGDSITEGWLGAGKEIWAERYEKLPAANFGISGDKTQHVLWRIENRELEGIKPKVVVLMIGTNNIGSNRPPEIASGIEKIVTAIRKKTGAKVLLLAIFPRGQPDKPSGAARTFVIEVNDSIANLDDGKNVRYLDLSAKFLEPDGSLAKEIMPDALHLSAAGYKRWADGMDSLLREMMP